MKALSLLLATALSTVIVSPAMASDWFVGGAIGNQKNNYDIQLNQIKTTEGESDTAYFIRSGVYLNENSRVYATISHSEDKITTQTGVLASYDYLVSLNNTNNLNWFVGLTVGMNSVNPEGNILSTENDFTWGAQTGLTFDINEKFSTELGIRYLKQSYKISETDGINFASVELDNSQQVYLGLDYRF